MATGPARTPLPTAAPVPAPATAGGTAGAAAPWRGLTALEVEAARREHGANVIPEERPPGVLRLVARQLRDPMTVVLLLAAVASVGVLRETLEGAVILAVVALNVALSTGQQVRSGKATRALRELTAPQALVDRDGRIQSIPARELVPGDVVHVAAGDRVPADLEILEAHALAVDEALVTGESMPVDKPDPGLARRDATALAGQAPPTPTPPLEGEEASGVSLLAGTLVVRGRGIARVTAIGTATQMGAIAAGLADASPAPLQTELAQAARRIGIAALAAAAGLSLYVAARAEGDPAIIGDGLVAGVALAVAAVPEGLLATITAALAFGAQRMAARGAIVRQMAAIEAIGAATVLCVDKTGTLTEGRLVVAAAQAAPGRDDRLWLAAVRCNDATLEAGDPLEVALLQAAAAHGVAPETAPRVLEEPFDAATRSMTTVHLTPAGPRLTLKGAPEAVLPRCAPGLVPDGTAAAAEALARQGLRVLAFADAPTADVTADGLEFVGLVAFEDKVRPSAREAVAACHRAGIEVVMVTGDHAATAAHVGAGLGLDAARTVSGSRLAQLPPEGRADQLRGAAIVARVRPETKVELVQAHRAAGHIVAMMGDGVNDAPALRQADVGIAVAGQGGTQVAREAAGLVLTGGDLGTVVEAVRQGRRLYGNLVHVVSYLVAGNASEVLVVLGGLALLPQLTVPLAAVQLLWINLVTDGRPALALGLDDAPGDPLLQPARRSGEKLLGWRRLALLLGRGTMMAALVLATGLLALHWGWSEGQAQAQMVASLLAVHLLLVYGTRSRRWSFEAGWWRDRFVNLAVAGSLAGQVLVMTVAPLRDALSLAPLPATAWGLAAACGLASLLLHDAVRAAWRWRTGRGGRRPASRSSPLA